MSKYLEVSMACGTTDISYIAYGTIGYVKTTDNEVRQCKCIATRWIDNKNTNFLKRQFEWKVAGYKEHFFTFSTYRLSIGNIYLTEEFAQRGTADKYGVCENKRMNTNRNVSVHGYLMEKYGMTKDCFDVDGIFDNILLIKTYATMEDGTIKLLPSDIEIVADKDGFRIGIPMLDGSVNGIHRYPTFEKACAASKPLKVYFLDDDEPTTPKKMKITIEIECDKVGKIKELATIIDIKDK